MNSKKIIPLLIYILLVIIAITVIIFIFYYNPFKDNYTSYNTYSKIQSNIDKLESQKNVKVAESSKLKDVTDDIKLTKTTPLINKKIDKIDDKKSTNDIKKDIKISNAQYQVNNKTVQKGKPEKITYTKPTSKEIYSKGSSLPDQSFDSYGEYISEAEYNYRVTLIKNLSIKTVIIDRLTTGNGISQEFFKVVYIDKMIPAKILDDLVESKEFRNLIPGKYRQNEIKTKGLAKGEKVIFDNQNIKNLLILWSQGRLTPVQKAWEVKAEK